MKIRTVLVLACVWQGWLWMDGAHALAQQVDDGLTRSPGCCTRSGALPREVSITQEDEDPSETTEGETETEETKEKKPTWDVSNPPGPFKDVALETTEGTWMNLDVSPDGKRIVFDLLGDLYVVPIAGGEAEAITSGVAWDMQPRFSPDGKRIAFTSDRGGGDNIYVCDADGSNVRAVTKETFRLLNEPTWTPEGQYIAARKHFTSKRSIGAGEIWLYHESGGTGLQMTKRPNEQKDLGEPAFSPDGRYLYYSQDTTGGRSFQYNKDSNKQIYVIQRLDRRKGETETFVSGPGGSACPTPSPDGQSLAFVRRVRGKTCLFVQDIESGHERILYDGLDRDNQEIWAIHGVYPRMAWTPDGRSIVFWARGGLQRIDIQLRHAARIPFHVKTTRRVYDALRFPVEVAPDRFELKMLRWVRVSPAGDRVVYEALGHLYTRDLPDGTPKRLTEQADHFETYPAFSRDGRWIVYATWSDRDLGSIRIVSADGGEGRTITTRKGHYIEPVFTPDGSKIVYRRITGDTLRGLTWSRDPGVYWVGTDGGERVLITKRGANPQFGADSDRVYLTRVEREELKDKHLLISIDLDGSDERTHLTSDNATEFVISPDEQWVAFAERFNVYIAPLAWTGKPVALGPKTKSIPVRKVSHDTGHLLQWSGDSSRLYWSWGPRLFERDLKDTFAFVPGAPEKLPEPVDEGLDISFAQTADVPTGALALTGARIITMRGDEVIDSGTIVVERNRITAVGPKDAIDVPDGATVVDVSGATIYPGLIDVHDHGAYAGGGLIPQQNWRCFAKLAFGVTTVHDPSNNTEAVFAAQQMQRAGIITAPRIFSTGQILYGAAGAFKSEISSLDDARFHLRRMQAVGAFSVKSYNQPRRDQRQQVIAAARELGMMVVPEGGALFEHNMTMIVDGHTGIEHSVPLGSAYKDVIDLWAGSQTSYTPTLIVGYGGLWGEQYWYAHTNVWENKRLLTFTPRRIVDPRSRRRQIAPEEEYNHISAARICKQLTDAGVKVNLGAHGQLAGLGDHWEMWMFGQGGMTPLECLRAATLNPAHYLGLDGDIGSLEVGKLADLVVCEKNPLDDIRNSEAIQYTMINGRLFDAHTMNELGNHPHKRDRFYWER